MYDQNSLVSLRRKAFCTLASILGGISIRLQILSDLHLEFHPDGGRSFLEKLTGKNVDVLILAGDIHNFRKIPKVLPLLCTRYEHLIYVFGNHELYLTNAKILHVVSSLGRLLKGL